MYVSQKFVENISANIASVEFPAPEITKEKFRKKMKKKLSAGQNPNIKRNRGYFSHMGIGVIGGDRTNL